MKAMLLVAVLSLLSCSNVFCRVINNLQRLGRGGNISMCRTVGREEARAMSTGRQVVPTLSVEVDPRYSYIVDSNLDQQTRAEYEARIRRAEDMMREGDSVLATELLAQVPAFYQRQSSGDITFFARFDNQLP